MKIAIVVSGMNMGGIYKSLSAFLYETRSKDWDIDLYVLSGNKNDIQNSIKGLPVQNVYVYRNLQIYDRTLTEQLCVVDKIKKIFYGAFVRLFGRRCVIEHIIDWLPDTAIKYDVAISYSHSILTNGDRNFAGGCEYFVYKRIKSEKRIAWIHSDPDKLGYTDRVCHSLFDDFDRIVCVSEGCKRIFQRNCISLSDKAVVFYNICNEKTVEELSNEKNPYLESKELKFVTVCRLVEEAKGLSIIASICRSLMLKGYIFKWHIVGDGRDRQLLEGLITKYGIDEYLILDGFQSNPYPYIKNADLYVCTSRIEAFGISVREAQILGVPALMTPVISADELIVDGKNGIITGFDKDSIEQNLEKILSSPELLSKLKAGTAEDNTFKGSTIDDFEAIIGDIDE